MPFGKHKIYNSSGTECGNVVDVLYSPGIDFRALLLPSTQG